ncbi:hypothetical protein F8388_013184 [Cannabis sativa]|uniref:Uncharacterized protein n=1 Tax=Cannabis sativa TaxID=3483 RepID=A0A7J6E054_CANSA|nr:hypothetical protein F8388_013184 [Cannabis sativa]
MCRSTDYLRINDNELEVDGSKIRPDSPAFVSLHRGVVESEDGEVLYGSRDRVSVAMGLSLREEKVLKGSFWRDYGDEWRLECKCVLESEISAAGVDSVEAEVRVVAEGHVAMCERVAMVAKRKHGFCNGLEEIPEEIEVDDDDDDEECMCGCDCSSGEMESDLTVEIGGVKWTMMRWMLKNKQ